MTDANASVLVIDTVSNKGVASIKVGDLPAGVAITPDGKRAYVANSAARSVSVVDTASNTVLATVEVEPNPQQIAITPDGKGKENTWCCAAFVSTAGLLTIEHGGSAPV